MTAVPRLDVSALLDAAESAAPTEGVEAIAAVLADTLGAHEVSFLIADISGDELVRLARAPRSASARQRSSSSPLVIAGTPQGAALRTQEVQQVTKDGGVWVYAPVTQRGETLGVLELHLDEPPTGSNERLVADAAHALAYVIIAEGRYSDVYEWGQRSSPLALAAEIQRRLLPASYTCETSQFSLSGWLIPADEAGGDTFDYIVGRDFLHLSMTDAMGHGVQAAQLATLAVGSLRNSRRRGVGVLEMAQAASRAISAYARDDQFVTGQLLRVELATGHIEIVNAGHVNPLLVRKGAVTRPTLKVDPVFGVLPDLDYRCQELQLQPGDRLVLMTDGMYDRNAADANVDELLAGLNELHPRETVQALTKAVVEATKDKLMDDATALVLDWYGGAERRRGAAAGASTGVASD